MKKSASQINLREAKLKRSLTSTDMNKINPYFSLPREAVSMKNSSTVEIRPSISISTSVETDEYSFMESGSAQNSPKKTLLKSWSPT